MNHDTIQVSRIVNKTTLKQRENCYAFCRVQGEAYSIEINKKRHHNIANSVFFLQPDLEWKIVKKDSYASSGYVLYIPKPMMENPTFKNLHITEICLFSKDEIPKINLAPGIEKRILAIIEMLDELVSTNLKNKEEAILSLLKALFVYCDGKCNIKSVITEKSNLKSALVIKFKKCIDQQITRYHEVGQYAQMLNVSDKYLNDCVKKTLGVNAKYLIDEQLVMRSRHNLKFSSKSH